MIKEINFTKKAVEKINQLVSKKSPGTFFRIAVKGGGCSGFKYDFTFDSKIDKNDLKHNNNVVDIIWLVNMILSRGISSSDQQQINGALQRLINSNIPTQVERQQLQNQMNKLGRIQRGRGRRR